MHPKFILLVLFISAGHMDSALAASFDCSNATTDVEKLICTNEQLSLQDDLLATAYQEVIALPEHGAAQKVRQRQWLKSVRNACADASCLNLAYAERIRELKEIVLPINDRKGCSGEVKKALDLAFAVDRQIPDTARSRGYGRVNDGSLNYGGYWLRPDISLLYARLHCWQSAREVIGKIEQEDLQENSNANLSIEYAKVGYFGPAIYVLDSLKSEEAFSTSAYGIADAMVVVGRVDQAKDVIMRVTTRWKHLESPSYVLIQALAKAGRLNDAEKMMEGINYTWNEHLLLANAYMKGGKKERAESHIQKAISMAGDDSDAAAHTQGWAAYVYIDVQEFEKAYNAALGIPRPLDRLQAFLRLAEAQHNAGNARKSDELYAEAIQIMNGSKESDKSSDAATACSFITQSYGRSGNAEKVISTVSTYCPEKVRAAVSYGYAINELAKRGDVDGALRVQSRLDVIWKNDADGPIAAALARKGVYEQAATMTRGISNEFIRSKTVSRMASLTPPSKVIADWLEDTKTFKHDDHRAAAVQVLTAALARSKNSVNAMAWLEHQPPALVKARGYFGIAQGLLGIVPGTGSPGD